MAITEMVWQRILWESGTIKGETGSLSFPLVNSSQKKKKKKKKKKKIIIMLRINN